jgi:hypothetical protein
MAEDMAEEGTVADTEDIAAGTAEDTMGAILEGTMVITEATTVDMAGMGDTVTEGTDTGDMVTDWDTETTIIRQATIMA